MYCELYFFDIVLERNYNLHIQYFSKVPNALEIKELHCLNKSSKKKLRSHFS